MLKENCKKGTNSANLTQKHELATCRQLDFHWIVSSFPALSFRFFYLHACMCWISLVCSVFLCPFIPGIEADVTTPRAQWWIRELLLWLPCKTHIVTSVHRSYWNESSTFEAGSQARPANLLCLCVVLLLACVDSDGEMTQCVCWHRHPRHPSPEDHRAESHFYTMAWCLPHCEREGLVYSLSDWLWAPLCLLRKMFLSHSGTTWPLFKMFIVTKEASDC